MKTLSKIFALLLIPFLIISCKDSDDPAPLNSDFEVLSEYLINNDLDLPDILNGWITGAPAADAVNAFIADNYIMDIRSASDFATSHIEGAVNSSLGTILNDATNSGGKPIIVVCYTGQSAAHAVVALRLSGYPDAKVLKFGMSGWHSGLNKWSPNLGNIADGHANWVPATPLTPTTFDAPALAANGNDGASILSERVAFLTSNGFKGVSNTDVLTTPANYFINNFWDQKDVDHYGCIDGAYRIKPLTLANGEILNLNPSETIVTYCWTGQTSSMVTAYLTVLGYDAKSLKFGVNGMIYDELESHKFSTPSVDLPVVTE